ncbi:hypothetical protein JCM16303_004373 [Sporobolomyces ruberrimus]
MLEEYSPATMALREASFTSKSPRLSPSPSPTLRQTKSAFQLSPRFTTSSPSPSPYSTTNATTPSSSLFGWTRWYKGLESEKLDVLDTKEEPEQVVVSDQVTNLFKEAFRKRKELLGEEDGSQDRSFESGHEERFNWPESMEGTDMLMDSNRTSFSSSLNETGTLPSLDLDDFPSSFEYSPPRSRRLARSGSSSANLRSAQSNVTLKAPQMLRRVSSSASILTVPVELPPQSPHSPSSAPPSPTLSSDDFLQSPTLLSYSTTSSLSSASTSRSSSTTTSTTSSNASSSTSTSAQSDSSFRSRFSTLRKAASSAALNFFVPKEPAPPVPSTASFLLRDVLLKHDQSTPDSPSPPLPSHPFYHAAQTPNSNSSYSTSPSNDSDSYSLDSPSSAFPPFDPFTTFDDSPTKPSTFPPSPSSPKPRLLARQRSFIDPHTRSLRTAPSLLCTPPTPDKTERSGGSLNTGEDGSGSEEGSASSDGSSKGGRGDGKVRARRKRGKRKNKSVRNLRDQTTN